MRARLLLATAVTALGAAACTAGPAATGDPTTTPTPTRAVNPAPVAKPLVIGVIGDFGTPGRHAETMVSVLASFARRYADGGRLAALVTTGDDAYDSGTTSEAAFARRLLAPLLGDRTRLVASLGNHDEITDGGAPVKQAFGLPASYYSVTIGPVQLVVLDANNTDDAGQLAWLRRTLAAPRTSTYRVAVFHQPAASCSFHAANRGVDDRWLALLDRGVDLVLSGHNHTYERFVDSSGLPLVTTGGGGASLYPSLRVLCTGPATPKVLKSTYNVVVLSVTPAGLQLQALDQHGHVFDRLMVAVR